MSQLFEQARAIEEKTGPSLVHSTYFLVSCVGRKSAVATRAQDLYMSDWFRKARAYVEASGSPWFILSAEHGLVAPDEVIAPYQKTLNRMNVTERKAWARRVMAQMDTALPICDRVVVFAGALYREFLMAHLGRRAQRVVVPMEGLRIGEQLDWLSRNKSVASRA